ncbi:MAG: DNA ligase [Chloroflexi bacterium]|nr:MAG: DNA ligase [Chloroflexota bacterium]TMB96863.1 MAG: DNA ligase [Chloroflexota bacterium]TMC29908.1 MAG: DNA ligase [Chloroflexota bacterium]TMC33752.1 MAG: DNA ligase [Chloroflexota bacterium]TMC56855.1 MAG: DNA ligase [Chloroflexota bacterium]
MLATLSKSVVDGPEWVFEEKYDGIRAIAERKGDRVTLSSRTGQDLTEGFAEVVDAIRALTEKDLVLDGELVVFDAAGVSRFQLLQRRGVDPRTRPVYVVFDVLRAGGKDLRARPLAERRARLREIVPKRSGVLMPSRQLRGNGNAALDVARDKGWEGVIAKLRDSRYDAGQRSTSWRKVKVRGESEFVIGGYTPPQGARAEFGALLVGMFDGVRLRYTGKVGTGYTHETLRDLGAKLRKLRSEKPPFDPAPRMRDATWVKPELVAQIAYAEWTADGKLRQPAFLGLRTDKTAKEVTWARRE